jgi:hypothetical protein
LTPRFADRLRRLVSGRFASPEKELKPLDPLDEEAGPASVLDQSDDRVLLRVLEQNLEMLLDQKKRREELGRDSKMDGSVGHCLVLLGEQEALGFSLRTKGVFRDPAPQH